MDIGSDGQMDSAPDPKHQRMAFSKARRHELLPDLTIGGTWAVQCLSLQDKLAQHINVQILPK